MPEIVVKYDNKVIEKVVTEKTRITIGRTSDNDIVLDNRGVSRKHALIEIANENALIMDNDSLNGTFVNDRKITEEHLRDNDRISIGKYDLIYSIGTSGEQKFSDLDGTMILQTKGQKDKLAQDQAHREITSRLGCSALVDVNTKGDKKERPIDKDVVTFGKSKFCDIKLKGLFTPQLGAKIIKEGLSYTLVNLGKNGYTKVNGEPINRYDLKNNDLVQIGKNFYKYIEAGS